MIELERRLFLAISGLFLLVYGVYTDTIFVNESRLSLRLDTFAENVLVKGYHRTYIRLRNREKIIVTCSKSEPQQNGTLMAFVNTKLATQVKCLRFHRDFINDDNFCESKQFVAYVEADQSSFVDVWCRMLYDQYKSEAYAELFLSRLYEDSEPRIRNGLTLTPLDATVTHTVNLESISCEAVKDRSDETRFDSLAWFTADSTFPLTPDHHKRYELVNINDQYVNYTSIFPLDSSLLRNNSIYKCCTLYDGKIQSCQRFLAYIYAPPPTTTTTTTAAGLMGVWNKNLKDWPKIFEGIEDRDFESDSSGLTSNSTASGMSDTLIAIIVASVAGTVIIMMIILLGVLCYRKYRYDQIYLKKDRISDMQSTMTTSNQRLRRGQLIPRVELRRSKADIMDDSMGRNGEPIRAYDNSLNMTTDDNSSWITNLGVEEIRRARALRENNPSEPISVLVSAQQTRVFASPPSRLQANQLVLDRNYERIEAANNMAAQNRTNSTTTVTMMATTPRLLDAKEQKRREKEMRRLAKLRVEAELKEAKLQAKLAKKQLKRGEPVALGVLSTLQSDDLDIDLYGIPRFQRASIEESVAKKTLSLEAMSLQNREQTNSITSSSFQLQPQPYHQQEQQQQQQTLETARDNKTSISNLSFVPPPFSISTQQQASQTPEASTTTTMTTNTSSAAGHHLRPTPNQNGNMYSRAVSYPSKENNINQLPLPLRDNNNTVAAAYYAAAAAAQQQQVSPGVEKNNIQETVYVSPNDNQIEVFSQGAALTPSAIKNMNNQNKRKSSNGLGNIHDSNLLY